jgi:hypothetical protein
MCYDIESSISAWIISNSIAIYLYYRNRRYDRWSCFFIITFSTIQLLEAGLWWSQKQGLPSNTNEILTKLVLLVLLSQPFVQSYFGYRYTKVNLLKYMCVVYFAIILWGIYRVVTASKGSFYTSPNSQGHLVWHDSSKKNFLGGNLPQYLIPSLYLGGLFIPLIFQKDNRGLPLIAVGVGSIAFSTIMGDSESFSSLWCFYAVIYSFVALVS